MSMDEACAAPTLGFSLPGRRGNRSFGRRAGKSLSPSLQAVWDDTSLPVLIAPSRLEAGEDGSSIHPRSFWSSDPVLEDYSLEIGFGYGEHLLRSAMARPGVGHLGADPFRNGVAHLLASWEGLRGTQDNLRVWADDAWLLLRRLAPLSLSEVYVYHPDPWPKRRHWKRRLIQAPFLAEVARVVKPGGWLFLATDHEDYAAWMADRTAEASRDWTVQGDHHAPVSTRYYAKALLEGRAIQHRFVLQRSASYHEERPAL